MLIVTLLFSPFAFLFIYFPKLPLYIKFLYYYCVVPQMSQNVHRSFKESTCDLQFKLSEHRTHSWLASTLSFPLKNGKAEIIAFRTWRTIRTYVSRSKLITRAKRFRQSHLNFMRVIFWICCCTWHLVFVNDKPLPSSCPWLFLSAPLANLLATLCLRMRHPYLC